MDAIKGFLNGLFTIATGAAAILILIPCAIVALLVSFFFDLHVGTMVDLITLGFIFLAVVVVLGGLFISLIYNIGGVLSVLPLPLWATVVGLSLYAIFGKGADYYGWFFAACLFAGSLDFLRVVIPNFRKYMDIDSSVKLHAENKRNKLYTLGHQLNATVLIFGIGTAIVMRPEMRESGLFLASNGKDAIVWSIAEPIKKVKEARQRFIDIETSREKRRLTEQNVGSL